MAAADAFYVTTPIYYVNDAPHIGHAYTTLACDALARFARLDGRRVRFLTGTDEHGQKVEKAARRRRPRRRRPSPTRSRSASATSAGACRLSNDDFIRTTEARHKRGVAGAVAASWCASGEIYLGTYAGWYSVRDEAFYAESELVGGLAPTGAPVEWVEEPTYFFRLSAWQDRLLALLRRAPGLRPAGRRARNEVMSFVKGGLQDLSVSRTSFAWGIPVPGDPDARHLRLARRAHQLHHRARLSRHRRRALPDLLAGRRPRRRQGHPALPRGLLAGLPAGRRPRAAAGASSPTAGGRSRARRCRSRSAT